MELDSARCDTAVRWILSVAEQYNWEIVLQHTHLTMSINHHSYSGAQIEFYKEVLELMVEPWGAIARVDDSRYQVTPAGQQVLRALQLCDSTDSAIIAVLGFAAAEDWKLTISSCCFNRYVHEDYLVDPFMRAVEKMIEMKYLDRLDDRNYVVTAAGQSAYRGAMALEP